jgi:hypothetical protein
MPLKGTEDALGDALHSAATAVDGDPKAAWKAVAEAIIDHLTTNALVTGTTPNGGPMADGKIS